MRPTPTSRTSAFSLANAATALLCGYLCLSLLTQGASAAAADATTTVHELPPRSRSHISTGFLKPALLVSAPTSSDASSRNRGRTGQRARRRRRQGLYEVRSSGGRTDSYGLMNGMFDNECMQRHMNSREAKEQ